MAEDHGAPEAGQLPRVWTRGRKGTESRQRVSGPVTPGTPLSLARFHCLTLHHFNNTNIIVSKMLCHDGVPVRGQKTPGVFVPYPFVTRV